MGLADQSDKVMNWHGVFMFLGYILMSVWEVLTVLSGGFCTNLVLICEFLSLQMINYG